MSRHAAQWARYQSLVVAGYLLRGGQADALVHELAELCGLPWFDVTLAGGGVS